MNKITCCTLLSLALSLTMSYAQQSALKVTAEVPLQFGVGYEGKISKRFSATVAAGVLTPPNSYLIINMLKELGVDDQITLMIENSFRFGVVGEVGLNYNFRKNYVGAFLQVIALQAGDAPTVTVEDYFDTSMSSYPAIRGRAQTSEKYLHLSSTLYQAGILYGHRFPLKNKRFEIDTEIGLSANIGSQSKLSSDVRNLTTLSEMVDDELSYYYSHYAFVPSLSVSLVYKLNKDL